MLLYMSMYTCKMYVMYMLSMCMYMYMLLCVVHVQYPPAVLKLSLTEPIFASYLLPRAWPYARSE